MKVLLKSGSYHNHLLIVATEDGNGVFSCRLLF